VRTRRNRYKHKIRFFARAPMLASEIENSRSTNKRTKFGQLIITKIIKISPPDVTFYGYKRWFSGALTTIVTWTKLLYVEPGLYWDWWHLAGVICPVFIQATLANSAWPSSAGRCNEYRRWLRPSLGRNGASNVTALWRVVNQFMQKKINSIPDFCPSVHLCPGWSSAHI